MTQLLRTFSDEVGLHYVLSRRHELLSRALELSYIKHELTRDRIRSFVRSFVRSADQFRSFARFRSLRLRNLHAIV